MSAKSWTGILEQVMESLLFTPVLCCLPQICFPGELQVVVVFRMELKERGLESVAGIQVRGKWASR